MFKNNKSEVYDISISPAENGFIIRYYTKTPSKSGKEYSDEKYIAETWEDVFLSLKDNPFEEDQK